MKYLIITLIVIIILLLFLVIKQQAMINELSYAWKATGGIGSPYADGIGNSKKWRSCFLINGHVYVEINDKGDICIVGSLPRYYATHKDPNNLTGFFEFLKKRGY